MGIIMLRRKKKEFSMWHNEHARLIVNNGNKQILIDKLFQLH